MKFTLIILALALGLATTAGAASLTAVGQKDRTVKDWKAPDGSGVKGVVLYDTQGNQVDPASGGGSTTISNHVGVTRVAAVAVPSGRVTVGNSATLVVAADPTRKSCLVCNVFTDKVATNGKATVTINSNDATDGKVLPPAKAAGDGSGACILFETSGPIYAIGDSASSKVSFTVEDYDESD